MTTIARLKVLMEADSHRLTSALARVKKEVFSVRNALGVVGGAAGLSAFMKTQLAAADEMQKFSDRIGIGVEALSELRHAAKLSGLQTNALQISLQRMTRRIGEVGSKGKGEAKDALERLGLSAKQLMRLSPDQQLNQLADALAKVENQSEKVALAQKLFDSEGVQMLQMLKGGSAGLADLREQARTAGVTLTDDMAKSAAEANDAMTQLLATVQALSQQLALGLAPEFTRSLKFISEAVPKAIAAFKTVGRTAGAIGATAAAIFRGDFSGAAAVGNVSVGEIYQEALEEGRIEKAVTEGVQKGLERSDAMVVKVAG